MKSFLLYILLLGMALIHIPRSLLHECEHHKHTCDHHENHDEDDENKNLSFQSDKCDLCTYAFHALDTPNSDVIRLSDVPFSIESSIKVSSQIINSAESILLRGPPNSFSMS